MKLILLFIFLLSALFSETTLCYKENLKESTINKTVKLDGGKCRGEFSTNDMIKNGWTIDTSKVVNNKMNYNHIFIFNKRDKDNSIFDQNSNIKTKRILKNINLDTQELIISNVTHNNARIPMSNLKIGQSGIIVHKTNLNNIIIDQAIITQSNSKYSIITFIQKDILPQNIIPTSKLTPSVGDKFILNHLYQTSLLIVPNLKSKKKVLNLYNNQNFLNENFFASYLKLTSQPAPTKKNIKKFTDKQQIGTIFLVIKNNLYIIDALSFKILDIVKIEINDETTNKPFLTKIDEIKRNFWDFGSNSIKDYNNYYSKLLNIK